MHISYNARTIFWSTLFPPVSIEREIQEILISTWFCHFFSQMCVQKVEINLFFFFNGQTYREERKPTKFLLFKWHTHWHTQKRRRKTFFSFSSCVRFMLGAYIYLGRGLWWPMIWTTRTKWRCCCASIIYFIFVILNVRISSVWTTSVRWSFFFSKCYSSTMSLLICAWEGVAPPSRDCWRINIFSRRNLTVRNWCTFTCSSLTASHTAEMSLLAFHLVFSIHFIRLNFEFWSLHSRLNVNKQVQCYIWLHTPLNLFCGIRTK